MSSANIIVQGDSCLTSSVSLSITTANKKGLRADPWCSPTSTLNSSVTPTAHLTTVLQLSYMSCTTLTYFSATPDFLIQHHSSSLGTLSYAFSRSTSHIIIIYIIYIIIIYIILYYISSQYDHINVDMFHKQK
ncbi:hypothetical protein LDENG_00100830 [Lucifuga dentata]|nr:hypothetical protein LDENG_00100830 [Lucifuga dentata]